MVSILRFWLQNSTAVMFWLLFCVPGCQPGAPVRIGFAGGTSGRETGLNTTLLSLGTLTGLKKEFQFNDFGDVQRSIASVSIVRNNKFVVLE